MTASVIIPALNEALYIGACIDRIRSTLPDGTEIVVVDNGSTDDTVAIARERGVRVLHATGTIGALRNIGVRHSFGDVLVFIDADVMVRPAYAEGFDTALRILAEDDAWLVGAVYGLPDNPTWLQRAWSDPAKRRLNHVPAGNMILRRNFFTMLGGFDESLPTGEDFALCRMAEERGHGVFELSALDTGHEGYSRDLRSFIRRETWLGAGDFVSLRTAFGSRIAQMTMAFLAMHAALPLGLLSPSIALVAFLGIVGICSLMVLVKNRPSGVFDFARLVFLWYCYFIGRSASLLKALWSARKTAVSYQPGSVS